MFFCVFWCESTLGLHYEGALHFFIVAVSLPRVPQGAGLGFEPGT
jgi:hypothetical protein